MQSFTKISDKFRSGETSPVGFLKSCLEQIGRREHEIQAFEVLRTEGALELAAESERRWRSSTQRSSIDGMPIGIKDIIETKDMPTQCGSPIYDGYHSGRDSASVSALRDAGAIILGKTVTTEFAGPFASKTRNPWNPSHTPGGSSSGSAAAVASGMLPVALGTQVVGSIIRPASYCGTFAMKPTVGAVNRGGSHDGLSQSAHGVLCASIEDGWNVLREIASRVGGDPGHRPLADTGLSLRASRPTRIGVLRTDGYAVAEPYAREAFERATESIAAAGVEIVWSEGHPGLSAIEAAIADAQTRSLDIVGYESIWPLKPYIQADASKLSPFLRDRLAVAESRTPEEYVQMLDARDAARAIYYNAFVGFDALVTLSATGVAPRGLESTGNTIFNTPASYLGVPSINLPVFAEAGLPFGLQVLGSAGNDHAIAAVSQGILELLGQG